LLTKSKFGFKVCFPRFTLFSAFYPLFRVLPSFPRFILFSVSAFPVPPFRFRRSVPFRFRVLPLPHWPLPFGYICCFQYLCVTTFGYVNILIKHIKNKLLNSPYHWYSNWFLMFWLCFSLRSPTVPFGNRTFGV
jgi:hypothetical protein